MVKENLERAMDEMPTINIDKSYMQFLKTMVGSEQITDEDAKFLKRQKDQIIAELRESSNKSDYSED